MNEIEQPLVSVIIPCYNHEKYVEQCIMSVVNQTYKNIQLIVIDDESKDGSFKVIDGLKDKYGFIAETQDNLGLSRTINKAITKYAEGKYITIIASDDYIVLDRFERQVKLLEKYANLGFVFGKAKVVNDKEVILDTVPKLKLPEYTFNSLMLANYIPAPTAMIRMQALETVGLYDETSYIEDWDMWLRIADKYQFMFTEEFEAYYRWHEKNISSNYEKMISAKMKILYKWKNHNLYQKALDKVLLEELAIKAVLEKKMALGCFFSNLKLAQYLSFYKSAFKLLFINKIKSF